MVPYSGGLCLLVNTCTTTDALSPRHCRHPTPPCIRILQPQSSLYAATAVLRTVVYGLPHHHHRLHAIHTR
jgi:hypothetical protein